MLMKKKEKLCLCYNQLAYILILEKNKINYKQISENTHIEKIFKNNIQETLDFIIFPVAHRVFSKHDCVCEGYEFITALNEIKLNEEVVDKISKHENYDIEAEYCCLLSQDLAKEIKTNK